MSFSPGYGAGAYALAAIGTDFYVGGLFDETYDGIVTGLNYIARYIAPPDFSVDSVTPVQVLDGQPLVKDKATAVKAIVRNTGGVANNVSPRLTYGASTYTTFYVADPANLNAQYVLVADSTTYPLNFASTEVTKTIYFFGDTLAPPSVGTWQASVTANYTGAIAEADTTNNTTSSVAVSVVDTQWPKASITPNLQVEYFRTDWGNTPVAVFDNYRQGSNDFLRGTFPISP